jgi:hypothetical protein
MCALQWLGPLADPAVPVLFALLEDHEDYRDTRHQAEVTSRPSAACRRGAGGPPRAVYAGDFLAAVRTPTTTRWAPGSMPSCVSSAAFPSRLAGASRARRGAGGARKRRNRGAATWRSGCDLANGRHYPSAVDPSAGFHDLLPGVKMQRPTRLLRSSSASSGRRDAGFTMGRHGRSWARETVRGSGCLDPATGRASSASASSTTQPDRSGTVATSPYT